MSTFLREELGVAMSGVKWDVANYKLWQSTRDDIILFSPKQPVLATGANGRYQCAVSQFRQQQDGTFKITGGSAIFTVTSAIHHDARTFEELKSQWLSEMHAQGPAPRSRNPRFIPLNTQKATAEVLINEASGTPDEAHNNQDIGTPGGTNSFLVNLTSLGAQEWVQAIKEGKSIPAGVKMMYEYLRMMPTVGATVKVHGKRVFQHISSEFKLSANGLFWGGSVNIEAAWEKMVRDGTVEITFIGTLPPELEDIRQDLVSTFADQAREQLFDSLFQPKPEIEPAQAGDNSGILSAISGGGANFAFKFHREEEVTDLSLELRFEGWTWLKASMDADLTTLFSELDESYINEVNTEMSFPASILIDADPMLENVAVSWTPSEGKAPEAPVFGSNGGNEVYTITSHNPQDVRVRHTTKVNFTPSSWPVVEVEDEQRIGDGGNQLVIKPASWIGRHMIYMFVQEGDEIKFVDIDNDHLVVNVSYQGSHLSRAITASARITPFEPIEFSYPLSPTGDRGAAKFSAFGVVGDQLRRSAEQAINFDEEAVFILATDDGIELVTQSSIASENSLADRLRQNMARPSIAHQSHAISESVRPATVSNGHAKPHAGAGKGDYSHLQPNGSVSGFFTEYQVAPHHQFSIVLSTQQGKQLSIPIKDDDLIKQAQMLAWESDEHHRVRVRLDENACASGLTVEI